MPDKPAPGGAFVATSQADHTADHAGAWSVEVHGDIDSSSSLKLTDVMNEAIDNGARLLLLRIAGVGFLDSSGLTAIVRADRRLGELDGQLLIEGASGATQRTLEITGLLDRYTRGV